MAYPKEPNAKMKPKAKPRGPSNVQKYFLDIHQCKEGCNQDKVIAQCLVSTAAVMKSHLGKTAGYVMLHGAMCNACCKKPAVFL